MHFDLRFLWHLQINCRNISAPDVSNSAAGLSWRLVKQVYRGCEPFEDTLGSYYEFDQLPGVDWVDKFLELTKNFAGISTVFGAANIVMPTLYSLTTLEDDPPTRHLSEFEMVEIVE